MLEAKSRFQLSNPVHFLALGFGSGLAPKAPGTFGTLAAIPIFLFLSFLTLPLYLGVVFLFAIAGIYICGKAANDASCHDHPAIVWDEVVGFLITMIAVPPSVATVCVGFIAFRVFDIVKPWPISYFDKQVHGGLGIMLDDVIAGIFAAITVHLLMLSSWL
ncbi:phosphatidylglycerophosphatase A family protein [Algicola sagamiensis]|uniref:phosphatidylglycerophosphatase A family protein n=1 Tax=Algicola sagamiensis TaxID=163869 RepID=UPI00036BD1BA|nr:phosphatidylglycerophosphatase A [Algicola sagamiensis]